MQELLFWVLISIVVETAAGKCNGCIYYNNTDFWKDDIKQISAVHEKECCSACINHGSCGSWTFFDGICYLKGNELKHLKVKNNSKAGIKCPGNQCSLNGLYNYTTDMCNCNNGYGKPDCSLPLNCNCSYMGICQETIQMTLRQYYSLPDDLISKNISVSQPKCMCQQGYTGPTCSLVPVCLILPITTGGKLPGLEWKRTIVAGLLAMYHLNTHNSSIITDIESLPKDFGISFKLYDSLGTTFGGLNAMLECGKYAVMIGPRRSSTVEPLAQLNTLEHRPHVTFSATATYFDAAQYGYLLRTIPSDNYTAGVMAEVVNHFGWNQIAFIMSASDEYTVMYFHAFQASAINFDISIFTCDYDPASPDSLLAIKSSPLQLNILLVVISDFQWPTFFLNAEKYGMAGPEYVYLGSDTMPYPNTMSEKFSFLKTYMPGVLRLQAAATSSRFNKLQAAWQWPTLKKIIHHSNNSVLNPLNGSLGKLKSTDMAAFLYDAIMVVGLGLGRSFVQKKNVFNGTAVLNSFLNFEFNGTSGKISFDKYGNRQPNTSTILLQNYQCVKDDDNNCSFINISIWSKKSNVSWDSNIYSTCIWRDGSTIIPSDKLPYDHSFDDFYRTLQIIGSIILLGLLVVLIIIIYYRNSKFMKAASSLFLGLIVVGAIITVFGAIFQISVKTGFPPIANNHYYCITPFWLREMGFTIMFSSIALKLLRIYLIFSSSTLELISVRNSSLLKYLFLILLFQSCLIIPITIFTPITIDPKKYMCQSTLDAPNASIWIFVFLILNECAQCIQIFVAVWLLDKTMSYPSLYTESHYTMNVMFIIATITVFFALMGQIHLTEEHQLIITSIYDIFLPPILTAVIMYPKFYNMASNIQSTRKSTICSGPELLEQQRQLDSKIVREEKKKKNNVGES